MKTNTDAKSLAELCLKSGLAERYVRGYLSTRRTLRNHRDDLEQEARIGIMRAAGKFDPSRGVPFDAYACQWIKSGLRLFVERMVGACRVYAENGTVEAPTSFDAGEGFEEPVGEFDPSNALDGQRVWNDVSNELQSAPLRRGSGKGYEVKRREGEGRDFLRHAFGNVPLRTLADEQGLALTSVQSHVQRVRGEFYARYPQVARFFEDE